MERPRILVAEDRPEILEVITLAFSRKGCEVRGVSSGDAAFAVVQTERMDLLISDIRMPDGTGIHLLRRLRRLRREGLWVPPVIIVTAIIGEGERYVKALGASEVILKPFSPARLVESGFRLMGRALPSSTN